MGNKYLKGAPIRQEYLEAVLKWISDNHITDYMSAHQLDKNANGLWLYYTNVIEWVKTVFGEKNYRKEMSGLPWGFLYNKYKDNRYDSKNLKKKSNLLWKMKK